MYRATRELIKSRQQHTEYVVEKVKVIKISGGKENECFGNACKLNESNEGSVVSGWLVSPYSKSENGTAIIAHFWNVKDGVFYDSTPMQGLEGYEYVVDSELAAYGQRYYDQLDSLVPCSLWLTDGNFYRVINMHDDFSYKLSQLTSDVLFAHNRIQMCA